MPPKQEKPRHRVRIKEHLMVRASELDAHPDNWRIHPPGQREAMEAILGDVGYIDELKVVKRGRRYRIIDGHLRADIDADSLVPIAVLDLTEAEERKALATFDWVTSLAERDEQTLAELMASVDVGDERLLKMFAEFVDGAGPPEPPGGFKDFSGAVDTEHKCPRCGYEWSGKA